MRGWRERWQAWARLRFALGGRREQAARAGFERRCREVYRRLAGAGHRLDFGLGEVRAELAASLGEACGWCGQELTVTSVTLARDVDPEAQMGRGFRGPGSLAAQRVCCEICELGKGELTGGEWLRVLAAVAGMHERSRQDVLRRLVEGTARRTRRVAPAIGGRAAVRGAPGGAGPPESPPACR